jgi:hypothetical protein
MMGDLKSAKLIYIKAGLFLLSGLLSAALLIAERPTLKVALLLAISVWCFARLYYFMFYVIEHYVDPGYRFAGIVDFLKYLVRRPGRPAGKTVDPARDKASP